MKKIFLVAVALILVLCMLVACGPILEDSNDGTGNNANTGDVDNNTGRVDNTGNNTTDDSSNTDNSKKFTGTISRGTPFSEGVAVVTDGLKTYCIDKQGNIVFELDVKFEPHQGGYYTKGFQNGLIKIEDNLYDKTGKETKPEDVGVTKFYDQGLPGGYIIAVKEEATYNSTKQSLGIMNTKFEWIVPLSEELYQSASRLMSLSIDANAVDGYIFDVGCDFIFEVSTSKCYDFSLLPEGLGEYGWTSYTDGSFRYGDETILFTVEGGYAEGDWVNGKHLMSFYNSTAQKYFFTVIDKTGKFDFDPIELNMPKTNWGYDWTYEGRYIVVADAVDDSSVYIYDTSTNTSSVSSGTIVGDIIFSDGIIAAYDIEMSMTSGTRVNLTYYDMNFNPLFS